MKVRYPVAGLFLILELPVLLAFALGAFVAAIFGAVAVACSRAALATVRLFPRSGYRLHVLSHERGQGFARGYGYRLLAPFHERRQESARRYGYRLLTPFHERRQESARRYGYRLLAPFHERGSEWVILALGLAAAVGLGALIAG